MIAEQLQAARAAHWRQQQNPILTLEDAQGWLAQHPLCLYLPRRAQLPAPAPSFVEACLGSAQATPGPAAIEQAQALLTRLTAAGTVVPLNLLGTLGEQPDFLAHADALPSVLSLRADSDWKHAPQKSSGHKVSPLVLELWKLLDQQGALTAAQARETLGRELTEAAVLRALSELWQALRVSPVYGEDGQPAHWEMLRMRHREALGAAGSTGQVTAISLLVSMYLQSVYAATGEEIEVFLSPVTSRSRVREAVRGLSATRQIQSLSMDAQTYYFLENGLPEFAAVAAAAVAETSIAPVSTSPVSAPRPRRREHPLSAPPAAAASAPPPYPVRPARKPESKPENRLATPAARSGWKSPARSARPERAPWKSAVKPPASGEVVPWAGKEKDPRPRSQARPGGPPAAGSRPPYAGKRSDAPYRAGQKPHERAFAPKGDGAPRRERTGSDQFRPRPANDARKGAARSYRPAGRPPGRPSGPPASNQPAGAPPFAASGRPPGRPPFASRPKDSRGGAPRSGPPNRSRPPRFAPGGSPGPRPVGARSVFSRKPERGAPAGRPPSAATSRPGPRPGSDRPRPGGFSRPGGRPAGANQGRPPRSGASSFKPRAKSGPPRSGPPRSGPPRSGPPRSGPPKSGPPGSSPRPSNSRPRPGGFSRPAGKPTGAGQSRPPRPGGSSFKPRAKSGPAKSVRRPGDYPRRKPDRKKPGA